MKNSRAIIIIRAWSLVLIFSSLRMIGQTTQKIDTCVTFQDSTIETDNSTTTIVWEYYPKSCAKKYYSKQTVTTLDKPAGFITKIVTITWDEQGKVTYKRRTKHKTVVKEKGIYHKWVVWEIRDAGKLKFKRKKSTHTS